MVEEWEKRFDERFSLKVDANSEEDYLRGELLKRVWKEEVVKEIKSFIHSIREQDRQSLVEEIEKIKYTHENNPTHSQDELWCCLECYEDKIKNQTLSDIIAIIKER